MKEVYKIIEDYNRSNVVIAEFINEKEMEEFLEDLPNYIEENKNKFRLEVKIINDRTLEIHKFNPYL